METGFVSVHNVHSRVVTCGGWLDETFKEAGPKEMVLVIPGNPGLTGYYEEFVEQLYQSVKMPVWVVCHAGHELEKNNKIPSIKEYPHLFDLNGQIKHKVEFIQKYIPTNVKIHLIGHSVGSYIILNILQKKLIKHDIIKSYLLFPAIEQIGSTPNGYIYKFFANYLLWLILMLSCIFRLLPKVVGSTLVSMYFMLEGTDRKNVRTTMHLIHPTILQNIFFLASDEMVKITELDAETVSNHKHMLYFYYGTSDGWAPLEHYHNLKQQVPDVEAFACKRGIKHAFVLNSSSEMAQIISEVILGVKG